MLTTVEKFDTDALTLLQTTSGMLGIDVQAGLYTNSLAPSKTLDVSALVEPLYASYVRQDALIGPPFRDPVNGICSLSAALLWRMTGTPTPCIIQGVFYVYGLTHLLIGIEPFPVPIALTDDLDGFTTVLEYIQSNQFAGFTTIIR